MQKVLWQQMQLSAWLQLILFRRISLKLYGILRFRLHLMRDIMTVCSILWECFTAAVNSESGQRKNSSWLMIHC